jgi:hypothetical protein
MTPAPTFVFRGRCARARLRAERIKRGRIEGRMDQSIVERDQARRAASRHRGTAFEVGDRVQLARAIASDSNEPVGTVVGFVTPDFAARFDTPDDVLVRWDSGIELPHAPASLKPA